MIIGIDLGTTNSLISVYINGSAVVIPNRFNKLLTPSIVAVDDHNQIVIGQAALALFDRGSSNVARLFKRYMGTKHEFVLNGRKYLPEELSALILKSLKSDAEAYLGEKVTEAVISVPAYFNETQRRATKIAGQLADLKVEKLINEPTAAALAYGVYNCQDSQTIMVLDIGGGTFDVSILELFDGIMEVKACGGDNYLGGEDFTECIMQLAVDKLGIKLDSLKESDLSALYANAEVLKDSMSRHTTLNIDVIKKGKCQQVSLSVVDLERAFEPLIKRIRLPIERTLRDCKLMPSDLNAILLVGGSSRLKIIRNLVGKLLNRIPSCTLDPDTAIAKGVGIQAALKASHKDFDEIVLTDVAAHTLGIEVVNQLRGNKIMPGIFEPIIERGCVVPSSKSKEFCTVSDNQEIVNLEIYQGESHMVVDNVFLGRVSIPVLSNKAGTEVVEVRFTYDVNGILEVEAESTQAKRKVIIEENPGQLSKDEIAKRFTELQNLKIHPKERIENKKILIQLNRLHEELLGEYREIIGMHLDTFTILLDNQDIDQIDEKRAELTAFISQFQNHILI